MLFKPYNVTPHCTSIDAAKQNTFSFIFSGDDLTNRDFKFYNAETNELVRASYVPEDKHKQYNNEKINTIIHADTFENGKKYKYKMNLYQEDANIFVVKGKIRSITDITLTNTQIPITAGIAEINSPIYYNDTLFGACYIEVTIGGTKERRMITNANTGISFGADDEYGNCDKKTFLEINTPFSSKPTEGMEYRIYRNYITTPEYYFECIETPEISATISLNDIDGSLYCKGEYSQAQGIGIKNYQFLLYKDVLELAIETTVSKTAQATSTVIPLDMSTINISFFKYVELSYASSNMSCNIIETRLLTHINNNTNAITVDRPFTIIPNESCIIRMYRAHMTLVDQSDIIYSSKLTYTFDKVLANHYYKLKLIVNTQNDTCVEFTTEESYFTPNESEDVSITTKINNDSNSILINGSRFPVVTRIDQITHDEERIIFGTIPANDYTAASNKKYKYRLTGINKVGDNFIYGRTVESDLVEPIWNCWTIYALGSASKNIVLKRKKDVYYVDGFWRLYINTEESDITQNLNRYTHVTYGKTPKVIMNNSNYISGSITCDITQIECPDITFSDTIYMVEAWRKFISQYETYLLKNPKGDVWAVSIHDNPTSAYDYNFDPSSTQVTFNFIESHKLDDLVIG